MNYYFWMSPVLSNNIQTALNCYFWVSPVWKHNKALQTNHHTAQTRGIQFVCTVLVFYNARHSICLHSIGCVTCTCLIKLFFHNVFVHIDKKFNLIVKHCPSFQLWPTLPREIMILKLSTGVYTRVAVAIEINISTKFFFM